MWGWLVPRIMGCLDAVPIDETHQLQTRKSQVPEAFRWLRGCFVMLVTARPICSNAKDLQSLLALVESRNLARGAKNELGSHMNSWELAEARACQFAYGNKQFRHHTSPGRTSQGRMPKKRIPLRHLVN
jgi:hypothetical protein